YLVVEDVAGYNTTSVAELAQDISTLIVNDTRDVTAGVVLFNAGDIKNYIYKVEGLSGVTNVTVVAKNAGDFGITVAGVDTSFVGLNITPDNASFSGTSTVTFFIDKSVFDDSGAKNDSVVVKHYVGITLVGSIDANIIELDPIKGYKFNFTTTSFSTFIPTYTAPVVETPDDDGDSSSSSSTGGMGGALPAVTIETKVVNLTANVPLDIDFTVSKTLVDTLQLTTTEGFENVDVIVEKISTTPADVSVPAIDSVYNYIQVTHDDVSNDQISRAILTFVVDISWFEDNNETKDDVVLLRYADGVWNDLATTYISSDGTYYYFDAVSPGLSYFAIGTKTVEVADEPVVVDDTSVQDDTTDETVAVEDDADTVIGDVSKPGRSTSTVVAIIIVLVGVIAFVLLRKKKHVVKTEAVSEIKAGSDTPDSSASGSDNAVADNPESDKL
ncbi:MAG: PGF-pre-PGF domain-containing protein, partial [Candidatus Aenigmarchaeota archaeon]|nr:PGF-pre-PGF domain-containing protein [Candidatus Aenigmarchaeota archaeon]